MMNLLSLTTISFFELSRSEFDGVTNSSVSEQVCDLNHSYKWGLRSEIIEQIDWCEYH